jgi:hypothetical protein
MKASEIVIRIERRVAEMRALCNAVEQQTPSGTGFARAILELERLRDEIVSERECE